MIASDSEIIRNNLLSEVVKDEAIVSVCLLPLDITSRFLLLYLFAESGNAAPYMLYLPINALYFGTLLAHLIAKPCKYKRLIRKYTYNYFVIIPAL